MQRALDGAVPPCLPRFGLEVAQSTPSPKPFQEPMPRAVPSRRRTPFGRWVDRYRVARLITDLAALKHPVTHQAVYQWIGGKTRPRPDVAMAIARLSDGEIGIADVYRHQSDLRGDR